MLRRFSVHPLKIGGEMRGVIKTRQFSDFIKGHIMLGDQMICFLQFFLPGIGGRRNPNIIFKQSGNDNLKT